MKNLEDLMEIAENYVKQTVNENTVQTTGDLLITPNGKVIKGNIFNFSNEGTLFHYIYRNNNVELTLI